MPGKVIRVLEKTEYDWGGASIASGTLVWAAAQVVDVDVACYREIVTLVRVHSFTAQAGGALYLSILASAPTDEDPTGIFRDYANALISLQPMPVVTTSKVGGLYRAICSNPGGYITIFVVAQQGSSPGALKGRLSIDVSLKG